MGAPSVVLWVDIFKFNQIFIQIYFSTENSASNYPLRGTKGTLWEGGVRVPAFIWSPLLKNSGYLSDDYIQVTDWVPTLLEAIDSNYFKKKRNTFDGKSVWNELNEKKCSVKNEILLNIDPIWNMSSIIVNDWKLIQGSIPRNVSPEPNQWSKSFETEKSDFNFKISENSRKDSFVYRILSKKGRNMNFDFFNQSFIDCGVKNIAEKCDFQGICLYNIRSDPCEYNDLSKVYPNIVRNLWKKILNYNKTSVLPLNKPIDPKANPIYHNNIWDVWVHSNQFFN